MNESRPYTFDRVIRIITGLILLAAGIWLVNILKNVLLPFCLACLIAYLLQPLVEINRRFLHLKGRVIAVFLTLIEVGAVVGLLVYFCVPSVIDELKELEEIIKRSSSSTSGIPFVPENIVEAVRRWISNVNLSELLSSSRFESLLDSGTSLLSSVVDSLLHALEWLLTFIYVIFILIDYTPLMNGFRMLVPVKYRPIVYRVGGDIKSSMNRYFRGQALIAACAAVFYYIGFSIVGIPLAIVLGILVGILYMIPYFQYVTLIPVTLVCLINSMGGTVHFWPEFGECLLVYLVSQCICDYILTPKIMGKALGLNPAIILLSLSVWGTLMGLIGMIIALPMTTLLLAYYQEYVIAPHDPAMRKRVNETIDEITHTPPPPGL